MKRFFLAALISLVLAGCTGTPRSLRGMPLKPEANPSQVIAAEPTQNARQPRPRTAAPEGGVMDPYYADDSVQLFMGDCREVVPALDIAPELYSWA